MKSDTTAVKMNTQTLVLNPSCSYSFAGKVAEILAKWRRISGQNIT